MASCKTHRVSSLLLLLLLLLLQLVHPSHGQTASQENNTGFSCSSSQRNYPCQAYAFYSAQGPNFLDLASIGDLFSVSRLMISTPSNISSPSSSLVPNQPLFVPLTCSCNRINSTFGAISYANISYTIKPNDTFFLVSTIKFENLTTYPSVEVVNPNLVATNLSIGDTAIFPVFCKCPDQNRTTLSQNRANYMISYVVQPSDTISAIASRFGSQRQAIIDVNGNGFRVYDTIFVPVARLPALKQPAAVPSQAAAPAAAAGGGSGDRRTGTVRGLAIGLGITGLLLVLVTGLWVYREVLFKLKDRVGDEEEQGKRQDLYMGGGKAGSKKVDVKLMANVSDCLDKYRVFGIEELIEATDGFDENCLIQGSVYKGTIDGEVYAIKKMKWNAYEELKILQKVNHGNLVKLEGFCIDSEEANCYLVYEYVENGSLYSWLHHDEEQNEKLNWRTRLRIAIDIANGLQYIHEHTRPRVVHKDIKSSNILLDSNMRAKIANFGLAKSGMNAITMRIVGTQGYIAPEYLADGVVSTKMDVFSFGVVLLELISGKEAVDEDEGEFLWASAMKTLDVGNEQEKGRRLKEWIDKGIMRETLSVDSVMGVASIAIACLNKEPSKRPSIVDIVYALCKSEDAAGFDVSDQGIGSPRVMAR